MNIDSHNSDLLASSAIIKRAYKVLHSEGFQRDSEQAALIPYLILWLRYDFSRESLADNFPLRFDRLAPEFAAAFTAPYLDPFLNELESIRLRVSHQTLWRIVDILSTLNLVALSQSEFVTLFDYALDYPTQAAAGPNRGFGIPNELLQFITQVYPIFPGSRVYNPYAGTCHLASFLPSMTPYFGQEPMVLERAIGMLRIIAHRLPEAFIAQQDPMRQWPTDELWDIILVPRPIFRSDRVEDMNASYLPPLPFDVALVQRVMQSLSFTGRAIIAVPAGFLWNSSREYRLIRENLVTSSLLQAVIEFPGGVLSNTTAPIALLLLNRENDAPNQVLLLDAEDYTRRQGRQVVVKVADLLKAFHQPAQATARLVSQDEFKVQNFEFSPRRYLNPQEPVGKQGRLREVVDQLPTRSERDLPLEGRLIRIRDLKADNVEFTLSTDAVPVDEIGRRTLIPLAQDALLVALQGGTLKPTWYVHQPGQVVYLPPYIKPLIPRADSVDLAYLVSELNSDFVLKQVKGLNTGAAMPAIRKDDLLNLILRLPPLDEQLEIISHTREQVLQAREKEQEAVEATEQAKAQAYAQFASLKHALGTPLQDLASGLRRLERLFERAATSGQPLNLDSLMNPNDTKTTVRHTLQAMKQARDFIYETVHHDEAELNVRNYPLASVDILDYLRQLVTRKQATDQCFSLKLLDLASVAGNEDRFFGLIKFYVQANEMLLNRLFDNILDNSTRHGFANARSEQNKVNILVQSSFSSKYGSEMLTIIIMNNGSPLPDGWDVNRLFVRGAKAGPTGRTGIGGFEAREIVEYFKGSITVKASTFNGFTVAYVITLPVAASELQASETDSSDDVPSTVD